MDEVKILDPRESGLKLRNGLTGHVFSDRITDRDHVPEPVKNGSGPRR